MEPYLIVVETIFDMFYVQLILEFGFQNNMK